MKNWNDGKYQEFKDIKTYCAEEKRCQTKKTERKEKAEDPEKEMKPTRRLLFVTPTCPNCKMAEAFLDKAGISYETIDATKDPELAQKYKILQAPTLVDSGSKIVGPGAIRAYVSGRSN